LPHTRIEGEGGLVRRGVWWVCYTVFLAGAEFVPPEFMGCPNW